MSPILATICVFLVASACSSGVVNEPPATGDADVGMEGDGGQTPGETDSSFTDADVLPCGDEGPSVELTANRASHCHDDRAVLSVTGTIRQPASYQWLHDGVEVADDERISGADSESLTITGFQESDAGSYAAVVTDECGTSQSAEVMLHWVDPCLTRDAGGHFLMYRGEPLLAVGESGTQVVMQNANVDYRQWIDDLSARGIRALHLWALLAPRQGEDGPFEERYGYFYPGLTPWARKSSGPLAADGLYQWDLQTFDEGPDGDPSHYWSRLRDLCSYAMERGILVGISVFFGWVKFHYPEAAAQWKYHPFSLQAGGFLGDGERWVTMSFASDWLGRELWESPFNSGWWVPLKAQWHWERFAIKLMEATAEHNNVFFVFIDEHSVPDGSDEGNVADHFRNFFQSRGRFWVDWSPRRSVVDAVFDPIFPQDKNSIMVGHFNATPARPFLLLESPPMQGEGVREAIWTMSVAGGNYFFHADEGQEHVGMGIQGYDPNVFVPDTLADDRYGSYKRDWLGHASVFFNERVVDLLSLRPHNALCPGSYCFASPGSEYVLYSKKGAGTSLSVDLTDAAGTSFDAYFYDPRTGDTEPTAQVEGGAVRAFSKPDSDDWVLHIVQRS